MVLGDYAAHSFRIGAAPEAARWGLPEEVIKRIGRWESRTYHIYVRPPLAVNNFPINNLCVVSFLVFLFFVFIFCCVTDGRLVPVVQDC